MAIHPAQARGSFTRGQPQRLDQGVVPAPIGGMDGRENLASNNPEICIYAYNLVPSEYGMRTRDGFREHATDVHDGETVGAGVRTLIPFTDAAAGFGGTDRLFAATDQGLFDVSTLGSGPFSAVVSFGAPGGDSGWGSWEQVTADNGEQYIFYADEVNGLWRYTASSNSWSVPPLTGVDAADIAHVVKHKQRLWFTERGTTRGWYLAPGAIEGAATLFTFGGKFRYGGDLVGLYNWTLDSGAGVDDILVAVGRGGDVLPYQGDDPAFDYSWQLIGSFYIGRMPRGRRVASEYGGDLHLISAYGLTSMQDLLRGVSSTHKADSTTLKIARFIREDMRDLIDEYGWEIKFNTNEGVTLINTPRREGRKAIQYRMNFTTEGWAFWRGVPGLTFEPFEGTVVFGTEDNRVMRMDVEVDNSTFTTPQGEAIEFSLLHNFLDMGSPAQFKWGRFARPNFVSTNLPVFSTQFLYDYLNVEIVQPTSNVVAGDGDKWDSSNWDEAIWFSPSLRSFYETQGGAGQGRTMAVAIRGSATARATLASTDVMWTEGGPL